MPNGNKPEVQVQAEEVQVAETPTPVEQLVQSAQPTPAPLTVDPQITAEQEQVEEEERRERERRAAEQKRFEAKRRELTQPVGPAGVEVREPTDREVLDALEEEDREVAEAQQEEQQRQQAAQQQLQQRVVERRADLERAAARGITLKEDPELDVLVEEQAAEEIQRAPATAEDVQAAQEPTVEEVEEAAQPIRQERATQIAEVEQQGEQVRAQQAAEKVVEEKDETDQKRFTSMSDIFESGSVGQKMGTILAVLAGGMASGIVGGPNQAVQALNQVFDSNLQKMKLDADERDRRRKAALRIADQELARRAADTKDQLLKTQIAQMRQEMALQQGQLSERQQFEELMNQGKLQDVSQLSKEDRNRAVRLPDGTLRLADNKASADDVRKFANEVTPAIKGAQRILRASRQGSRFSLEDRARIATELKALVGNLRIPFTGPGILTDKEYDRLVETIGNPNSFLAFPSLERKKLQTVVDKLTSDVGTRFKNAGIEVSKEIFEDPTRSRRVKAAMGRGLSKDKAEELIDRLEAEGKL